MSFSLQSGVKMSKYPWYGRHQKDEGLDQGLILPDFPIPDYSGVNYTALATDEDVALPIEIRTSDLIIMTQACDISNDKVKNITLCKIYPLNEYLETARIGKKEANNLVSNLNSNRVSNMHLLNRPDANPYGGAFEDFLVVKFDESVVFPVRLVQQALKSPGRLIKLMPPYRESLAQAYGAFFMRIGDPQDREMAYSVCYESIL